MNISLKCYRKSENEWQHANSMVAAPIHVLNISQQIQKNRGSPTRNKVNSTGIKKF